MNRKEILQMSEGRKMRELMATLIMGWELYEPEPFDDRPRKYWRHPETKESRSVEAWHPDENMTDAWMVMERLREIGRPVSIYSSVDGWMTNFDYMAIASGESAPLSICRAALLAIVPAQQGGV